jgi:hypothetical protein
LIKKHIKKKYYMVNARFYCAFIYHWRSQTNVLAR